MKAPVVIEIADQPIRSDADRLLGINVNYIRDHDDNRPGRRPLADALAEMAVRWIRYPGGGKSDLHRWALPPYASPESISIGGYEKFAGHRMNFDDFLALCRAVDGEPFVVLGYHPEKRSGLTRAEWIESAVRWVRWSREHGARVRWWEIGNENWNTEKGSAEELADVVRAFSDAIRAEDPTIRLGASGHNADWWSRFLPLAAHCLDFLTYSQYSGYGLGRYERYLEPDAPDPVAEVRNTIASIRAAGCDLPLIVTETNSTDYGPEPVWEHRNSIGHAIVTFETMAGMIAEQDVLASMLWTTRWMNDADDGQYYALDPANELTAAGRALQLLSEPMLPILLAASTNDPHVSAYAARTADESVWTVWLSNRSLEPRVVSSRGIFERRVMSAMRLAGQEPDDNRPTFQSVTPPDLNLPPLSVTAYRFDQGPSKNR